MPFDYIHEVDWTVNLVEQMLREAGAVHTPPDWVNRPLNTAQRARDKVEEAKRRLEASLAAAAKNI